MLKTITYKGYKLSELHKVEQSEIGEILTKTKLKSCDCGNTNLDLYYQKWDGHFVHCAKCNSSNGGGSFIIDAIMIWNTQFRKPNENPVISYGELELERSRD